MQSFIKIIYPGGFFDSQLLTEKDLKDFFLRKESHWIFLKKKWKKLPFPVPFPSTFSWIIKSTNPGIDGICGDSSM